MEPPWILVLCHEFPPLGGGAGKNLYLLCRELRRRGLGIRVWTGDPGVDKRWRHDFEVAYLDTGRKFRFETSLTGLAVFILKAVLRAWRESEPRPALVLSNLGIPAGAAGALVSRRFRSPHAVWYQGSDVHAGRPGGCGRLQAFVLRRIWNRAEVNFFVSAGLRDLAATHGRIPHPAILPTCPSPEIMASDPEGGLDPGQRYFLFLGRMEPVKNPLILLQAVALLALAGKPGRRFRLVGSGDLDPELKRLLSARSLAAHATLEPAAPFESVPDLLRSAYALVVPSRIEGFNTTILEAAHFGVPAVGSDTIGIRDFIRHGETGLVFKENDAASLAECLRMLAADPGLRDALGRKAKAAAAAYTTPRVADAFLREMGAVVPAFRGTPAEAPA